MSFFSLIFYVFLGNADIGSFTLIGLIKNNIRMTNDSITVQSQVIT